MGSGDSKPADNGPRTEIVTSNNPGEIIIWEHPNKQGRSWKYNKPISSLDAQDVASSLQVLSGYWVGYEHPDFKGNRSLFHRYGGDGNGYYATCDSLRGMNDVLSSLQPVEPNLIELYADIFSGRCDLYDSTKAAALNDQYSSCIVYGGAWKLYRDSIGSQCICVHPKGAAAGKIDFSSYFGDVISYVEFAGSDYVALHYGYFQDEGCVTFVDSANADFKVQTICVVSRRSWVLYAGNNVYLVHSVGGPNKDGKYHCPADWGGNDGERITKVEAIAANKPLIMFYDEPNFRGASTVYSENVPYIIGSKNDSFSSAIVLQGVWIAYEAPMYQGKSTILANNRGPGRNGRYICIPDLRDNSISSVKQLDYPMIDLIGRDGTAYLQTSSLNKLAIPGDRISSIIVRKGQWFLYSQTDYMGTVYYVDERGGPNRNGHYTNYKEWTGLDDIVRSALLISWRFPLITLYQNARFGEPFEQYVSSRNVVSGNQCSSIIVSAGTWILYAGPNKTGKSWMVNERGGPNGDGKYPWVEDWNGTNDDIESVELPDDTFYSVVVDQSLIKLIHIDHGRLFDEYVIEANVSHPRTGYLSNAILNNEQIHLKDKYGQYLNWSSLTEKAKPAWGSKGRPWIIKSRDKGAITSQTKFMLSPCDNNDLYLSYTHDDGVCLLPIASDPFEHDFKGSDFVADQLAENRSEVFGPESSSSCYYDDGPVLREEILTEIRYDDNFEAYQLLYAYINGGGTSSTTVSAKRGCTERDCKNKCVIWGHVNYVTVHSDSNRVTGILINQSGEERLLGRTGSSSNTINIEANSEFIGFRGWKTSSSITKLGIITRKFFDNGLLGRYFEQSGFQGTMDLGVYSLSSPPNIPFRSAVWTGSIRSCVDVYNNFSLRKWTTSHKQRLYIDDVLVFENGYKVNNNVHTFFGSCHSVTLAMEFTDCGRQTGELLLGDNAVPAFNQYAGQTDRDYLRSYLNKMPPTNAFGRIILTLLYDKNINDPSTEKLRTLFKNKPKLLQILTASFKDTEKDARSYMNDCILAGIDDELQKEAFGDVVLEKPHYVVSDDATLNRVQNTPEYRDLSLAYLGIMAYNSDKERFNMIRKDTIDSAIKNIWTSSWGVQELRKISQKLSQKYQPQLAFTQVNSEELSNYVKDICEILQTDSLTAVLASLKFEDQKEAVEAVIAVLFALDPEHPEAVEPAVRALLSQITASLVANDPSNIMDAAKNKNKELAEQLATCIENGDDDVKEVATYLAQALSAANTTLAAAASSVATFLAASLLNDTILTKDVLKSLGTSWSKVISNKVDNLMDKHKILGKIGKFTTILAGACGIICLILTANFTSPVDIGQFAVNFMSTLNDGLRGFDTFVKVLGTLSKSVTKLYNTVLTPIGNLISKVGSSIAAKATAISENFGKLVNFLGSNFTKLVGPVLAVIGAGFSFYSAIEAFKSGDIANGVVGIISGVATTVAAVIGAINAITGAIPVVNVVVAVVSAIIGIFAFLFALFWQPPKKKNKLVAKLYDKGWASRHLEE